MTDIQIEFINSTGNTDFQVVVFTKNFSTNTPETIYAAWQVISVQTSSSFLYPVSTSVEAKYDIGGQTNDMGPFPATLGSTWEIRQESKSGTPTLNEGLHIPVNLWDVVNVSAAFTLGNTLRLHTAMLNSVTASWSERDIARLFTDLSACTYPLKS